MLHIVVDLYATEKAFSAHVIGPMLEDLASENILMRQHEWHRAQMVCARLRKHLRRVGMEDRSHLTGDAERETMRTVRRK